MRNDFSLIRRLSEIALRVKTRLFGIEVGEDSCGQKYYRSRFKDWAGREERWILFKGEPEASKIPPEGRAFLQHIRASLLPDGGAGGYVWQKPHVPNLTGSDAAFLPPGHELRILREEGAAARRKKPWAWSEPA